VCVCVCVCVCVRALIMFLGINNVKRILKIDGVLDWRLDYLQVVTTSNYINTANFHILQIIMTHAKPFMYPVSSPVVPW
jgi:hypothetical protein